MKYTLATIIVNYGTHDRTIQYVKEELPKCKLSQLVIIVNNAATEDSTSRISSALTACRIDDIVAPLDGSNGHNIYVIHNPENSGYAKGNNIGVRFVYKHFDADYLLISNNDIVFLQDDVVERLIDKLKELPNAAVIGPKVVGHDGHCQSPYLYYSFWREMVLYPFERFIPFLKLSNLNRENAESGYYHHVMGSFFVTKMPDFIKCGMMDEKTFLFYEEWILSDRMKNIGKKEYYLKEVAVLHDHGISMKHIPSKLVSRDFFLESGLYYYREYQNVNKYNILMCEAIRQSFNFCINLYRNLKVGRKSD